MHCQKIVLLFELNRVVQNGGMKTILVNYEDDRERTLLKQNGSRGEEQLLKKAKYRYDDQGLRNTNTARSTVHVIACINHLRIKISSLDSRDDL